MTYRRALALFAAALLATPLFAQAGGALPAGPTAADAGVLVMAVQSGSPAEKAGLARGDIILEANGKTVNDAADLRQALDGIAAGATVSLTVRHGDVQKTLTLVAGTRSGGPWLGILPMPGRGGQFAFRFPGGANGNGFDNAVPAPGVGPMGGFAGVFPGEGALVESIVPGSPAEKAGLKRGDLILSVDGTTVDQRNPLSDLVAARKVGDTVTLSVTPWQEQKAHDVTATLAKNPDKEGAWLGLRYLPAPARFGGPAMSRGAWVVEVASNSPAARAGIMARDLLTKIDGADVRGPRQVVDAVSAHKPGDTVTVTVVRRGDGASTSVTVTLGKSPSDSGKAWLGVSLSSAGFGPPPGPGAGPGDLGPGFEPRGAAGTPTTAAPASAEL